MAGKIKAQHTWIIMNQPISKSYHMYFHWYNVSKLRNEKVTEVRLIVNIPFKWHNAEGHAHIEAKLIIICLESYIVWILITQSQSFILCGMQNTWICYKFLSYCEVVCGRW